MDSISVGVTALVTATICFALMLLAMAFVPVAATVLAVATIGSLFVVAVTGITSLVDYF